MHSQLPHTQLATQFYHHLYPLHEALALLWLRCFHWPPLPLAPMPLATCHLPGNSSGGTSSGQMRLPCLLLVAPGLAALLHLSNLRALSYNNNNNNSSSNNNSSNNNNNISYGLQRFSKCLRRFHVTIAAGKAATRRGRRWKRVARTCSNSKYAMRRPTLNFNPQQQLQLQQQEGVATPNVSKQPSAT